jgi:hypothetical protein
MGISEKEPDQLKKNEPLCDSFSYWVEKLGTYFFLEKREEKQVRLSVDRELLDQLGGCDNFIEAIIRGPEWNIAPFNRDNLDLKTLHGNAIALYNESQSQYWIRHNHPLANNDLKIPLFLPYLAALPFALTESNEANMHVGNFYDRIRVVFSDHGLSTPALIEWTKLWERLEYWSTSKNIQNDFIIEILGHHRHIGIPKAQALLSHTRIQRLPELFWRCGITPDDTTDVIAVKIEEGKTYSNQLLGLPITHEITSLSNIGISILNRIKSFLTSYDGKFIIAQRITKNENKHIANNILQNSSMVGQLQIVYADNFTPQYYFKSRNEGSRFSCDDNEIQIIRKSADNHILTGIDINNPQNINLTETLDSGEKRDATIKFTSKEIRYFDWDSSRQDGLNVLLECDEMPSTGGFVLSSDDDISRWLEQHCPQKYFITTLDQDLYYVNQENLVRSPLKTAHHNTSTAFSINFENATAIYGHRNTYLHYDLPMVVVRIAENAPEEYIISADNGKLDEQTQQNGIPGNRARIFAVIPAARPANITVRIAENESITLEKTFFIEYDPSANIGKEFYFDKYGRPAQEVENSGSVEEFNYTDQNLNINQNHIVKTDAPQFIEMLSQKPHWKIKELKDLITRMEMFQHYGNIFIEQLRMLGYIDILTDSKHRWASIHPRKVEIHLLPYQDYAAVTGCCEESIFENIIKECGNLKLNAGMQRVASPLIPNTLIIQGAFDVFLQLAENCKLQMNQRPTAYALLSQSAPANELDNILDWRQIEDVNGRDVYNTDSGDYSLIARNDPQTGRHIQFLIKRQNRQNFIIEYSNPIEKEWGLLYMYYKNKVNFPISLNSNSVEMQYHKPLPHLFMRALTLCTGKLPNRTLFDNNAPPKYNFQNIPEDIYKMIISKIGDNDEH